MVKSFLLIFLIVFAVAGLCEFVYILKMFLFFPNIRLKNYSLIILRKGYAIKQINYIWQKIKWHGEDFAIGVIAIADNIEAKEILECKNFINNKNIILCTASSLSECLQMQGS